MKRKLLISFSFIAFFAFSVIAENRYWVGGTGAWSNPKNWSLTSGGVGGAALPTQNDDVIFDQNSFQSPNQVVQINQHAYCHTLNFSKAPYSVALAGGNKAKLFISGNVLFSNNVINAFHGEMILTSPLPNTTLDFNGIKLLGKIIFDGQGKWKLLGDLIGNENSEIILQKGNLVTNGKMIEVGVFKASGGNYKGLDLGTSEVYILKQWDFSNSSNIVFNGLSARIIHKNDFAAKSYKGGSLRVGSVSSLMAACTPSNTPCATFTITMTKTDVSCNGGADGTANAFVVGGSGTFTYLWNPAPAGMTGQGSPNAGNLPGGNYTITVTDVITGLKCFCNINVDNPPVLLLFEQHTVQPTCFGDCDGVGSVVTNGGGTQPYTYLWNDPAATANDTATGLCVGTYVVTVTDFNGCTNTCTVSITQPTVLTAPGSFTNVSCNGVCDGTATVTPAGGTTPYSYSWAPAPGGGQGTASATGLCAGITYTCTVTDNNLCTRTYTAAITEPAVLTLTPAQTNLNCGGVCNGTATATIGGGTTPYSYVWAPAPGSGQGTATAGSLCAGDYTVTVTDNNGCTITQTYSITQPAVLTASITPSHVSCNGGNDGSATVVIGGGTPAFSIVWNPAPGGGQGTTTATALTAQVYTVTVTDLNGCTATATTTITQPTALAANASKTDITCNGLCDGTATSAPSGGTPPYSYSWAPAPGAGQGTPNATLLCAAVYTVTVTDGNLCTATSTVTVIEPAAITTSMASTNVTCNGLNNGTATVTIGGGVSPYNPIVWAPAPGGGQGTASVTGLSPATYTVSITDASGCTKTATVTITEPGALSVSASATALACNGDCNSTISTIVAGGNPPYTYLWNAPGSQTTPSLTNQCAGVYTVTVTATGGCTATASVTIAQPAGMNLNSSITNVDCFGNLTGSASVAPTGGTSPYTYLWQTGLQTTPGIAGQAAGTYTVTVTDANLCSKSDTLTITQPAAIVPNASVVSHVNCSGGSNGSATAAPTGGIPPYTYDWSPGAPTGDGTPTITGLTAGSYTVLVTGTNLCTATQVVTVTQPSVLTASISSSTASCNICNGTATVTASGGTSPYSYVWSPAPGGGQGTTTATGLCPTITYTVITTDANGCTASATHLVVQAVTVVVTTSNNTLACNGDCNGTITANVLGGTPPYIYSWNPPNAAVPTISNLCSGTYTVTVQDAVGCSNTASVTFSDPPALTVTTSKTNVSCGGAGCDGTATANPGGGTGAYSYSWTTTPVQTSQTATALCAGVYTVTVTDVNGCTKTASVTITQPTVINDNEVLTQPTCNMTDGIIFVSPTGGSPGYTYLWGPGAITGQGTNIASNLAAGIYTLAITDVTGCTFNFVYLLSNLSAPTTVMSKTDITCNGLTDGTATVVASGGTPPYTYNWLPPGQTGDGTPTITGLVAGTYTVQVTETTGCIKFDTITIIEPAPINPNAVVVNDSCSGSCTGSITTAVTGGVGPYTYDWGPGNPTTPSWTGLCPGNYTVVITDNNGCSSTNPYTITAPSSLTLTMSSTNVTCNGAGDGTGTATVGGGTPPYTYTWSHGNFPLPNVVALGPGTYTVTVTDANLCSRIDSVVITEPTVLSAVTSQTNITCNGLCDGITYVTPAGGTPGYTYLWNNTPLNSTTDTIKNLCVGSYVVVVTDNNGCSLTMPAVNITEPTLIAPNVTSTNPTCNGLCDGTATSAPTGGTGSTYTYVWTGGAGGATAGITALCAGSYTVNVTDSLGCSVTQTVTLTAPAALNANVSSTPPSCNNGSDGSVTSTPVGGTPTYTYVWTPVASTSNTISGLSPGIFTVVVTDANNCKDTQSVTIINTPAINAAISTSNATCGQADGSATVNPITGTPGYTYLWGPGVITGQGTPTATGLAAGIYTCQVTDALGCDSTFTIAISNAGAPTGVTETITNNICYGACAGSATILSVIGGTSPYSYSWNTVPSTPGVTASALCAGNYLCQITDANGCIYFHPVVITEPAQIIPNAIITNATCTGVCDGAITIAPTGGTGAYTYNWAPAPGAGQGTTTVTGLCVGTYTLTTTDANNCVKIDSFVIGQTNPLVATITSSLINCSNGCDGFAYTTISSGSSPFLYQWNDPLNQTNDTAFALCAGVYSVTITDAIGCVSTFTDTVKSNPPIVPNTVVTNATCGLCDGQATVVPTGGSGLTFSYLWSNGDTTATADSLCAGLYTVVITDSLGCVSTFTVLINNTNGPSSVTVTTTNATCNGICNGAVTSVVPVGGASPYSYLWVQSGVTTATISNLCAGTYYLQITDSLGCSLLDTVVITEPTPILANPTVISPTCNASDGTIIINPTGGTAPYTFSWSPVVSTNDTIINLSAGIYTVIITDNNGCSKTIVIPLNTNNGPTLSLSSTNITCNGVCNGTSTVTTTNGVAPYSYLWTPSNQVTPTATLLCAGTHYVTVTDANGCASIINTTITEPDSIDFSLPSIMSPLCNGDANGSITVIPNGGTLPYTYSWTPPGTTATLPNLSAGNYSVIVTDANGCTSTQAYVLTEPAVLGISNVATNPTCNTSGDGAIDITVTGGTLPYAYQWSGSSSLTTEDLTGLSPGTFIINVKDANGCTIADTIVLTALTSVIADAGNDTSFCQPGPFLLDASGSTNGVNYQWFLITSTGNLLVGSKDSVLTSPPTGVNTYYVTVNNGLGCSDNDTVIITANALPIVDAGNNVTIPPGTSTTIGGSPTGPAGSTYLWNPLPGLDNSTNANPVATPTVTTTYTVIVTSSAGCTGSDSVTVTITPEIITVSGFTPNGDGVNDEWVIPNIDQYPDCVVEVYNRWGEMLFQSVGYKERWKGTFKGKALPVGTYYYVIKLNDPLYPDPYTGPITIMR